MMDGPTSGRDVRTSAVPFVYLSTLISMCYKIYLPVLLRHFSGIARLRYRIQMEYFFTSISLSAIFPSV